MIPIQTSYIQKAVENDILEQIETIGGEHLLRVEDTTDLHDFVIEAWDICQIERVYHNICGLLPLILDDCISFAEDEQDFYACKNTCLYL